MPQCCVPCCLNRSEFRKTNPLSFYRFPCNEEEKRKWLELIRRENFTPNCNSRVCSWHFPNGKAAGPTRFAWTEGKSFQFPDHLSHPSKRRKQMVPTSISVSEMSSEVKSLAVESSAEGTDPCQAAIDVTPDDVDQLRKSGVQPLILSPDLLSGRSKFVCAVCGEQCLSLAQLAKHVQFHDHDRPFPCTICGKRFLSRSHHAEHQRVHTGERPFPCNRCERSFTTHHNLKRHQLIHDKEEMYRCTVCGVLFCQEHQLGNISGIIRVLKQHNVEELINPQELLELESLPKQEPAVETLPDPKVKTVFEEEQQASKKKRKHKVNDLHPNEGLYVKREEEDQYSFHSEVPQIHKSKEDFSGLVHRTGPKIQKIAYDIEIII